MKLLPLLVLALSPLVLALPSVAAAPTTEVSIEFAAYRPNQLDVLPGETVTWTNVSARTHTVTSDDGLFDSGDVVGGGSFAFTFKTVGVYRYHCTIHPSIAGEVDVRRVTLDTLPSAAVAVGTRVQLVGRTADATQPVRIERRIDGGVFQTVATAVPTAGGAWNATVGAEATADYRGVSGGDASEIRRLLVENRRILIHATRNGVSVSVQPSAPYARFLVQVYLRERFGWWPVTSGRVNYVSQADVRISAPARVRAVLVDKDGWTSLATSRAIRLRRR